MMLQDLLRYEFIVNEAIIELKDLIKNDWYNVVNCEHVDIRTLWRHYIIIVRMMLLFYNAADIMNWNMFYCTCSAQLYWQPPLAKFEDITSYP